MVNEKQTKRERNIRSKLMAAIAMLLVSSIMMVSTTYAWFTLSTAPEVTGITTNIASNGNLEIALSPASGVGTEVGNATTGISELVAKNLTWGNLVDMSDDSYNLGNLTLAPSKLYLTMTGTKMSLGANVLATPSYGADGRISGLNPNAFIASKSGNDYIDPGVTTTTVEGENGQTTTNTTKNPHTFGVRAVGTSSGLSAQASALRTARATMTSEIAASISAASRSLTETGAALAEMMITHAMATGTDTANYSGYRDDLQTLITELGNSVTSIDKALKAYLTAAATTIADETVFNTAITQINGLDMNTLDASSGKITVADQEITVPNEFALALAARKTIKTNIDAAQAELNDVTGTSWTDYSPLLNTSGANAVKINGKTMADIETMDDNALYPFAISMLRDATIELYDGSGLYYDLAEISGNIVAVLKGVQIEEINKGGIHLTNVEMERVTIKTAVPSTQAIHLTTLQAQTNGITAAASSGAVRVDTNYGYIIDLMVRTNAADTKLMLQTEGAQRVYGESNSIATMGNGTSFVFKTYNYDQVASLQNLLTSIRVVFFDPTQGANEVLGLAKVVSAPVVTSTVVGTKTVDGTAVDVVEYTITGYLELCNIVSYTMTDGTEVALTSTGTCDAGSALVDDQATPGYAEDDVLCDLTQNQAQPISVMVYLDGTNVTSADVLADESVTGALNLQFRSSADLAPMENSDLMNMVAYNVTKGVGVTGTDKVLEGVPYSFTLAEGYKLKSITIKGAAMTSLPTGDTSRHYSIDATSINGDIVIVTEKIVPATYTVTRPTGVGGSETATEGTPYYFNVQTGYTLADVTVGGASVMSDLAVSNSTYTIPGAKVTGNIVITVTANP